MGQKKHILHTLSFNCSVKEQISPISRIKAYSLPDFIIVKHKRLVHRFIIKFERLSLPYSTLTINKELTALIIEKKLTEDEALTYCNALGIQTDLFWGKFMVRWMVKNKAGCLLSSDPYESLTIRSCLKKYIPKSTIKIHQINEDLFIGVIKSSINQRSTWGLTETERNILFTQYLLEYKTFAVGIRVDTGRLISFLKKIKFKHKFKITPSEFKNFNILSIET